MDGPEYTIESKKVILVQAPKAEEKKEEAAKVSKDESNHLQAKSFKTPMKIRVKQNRVTPL